MGLDPVCGQETGLDSSPAAQSRRPGLAGGELKEQLTGAQHAQVVAGDPFDRRRIRLELAHLPLQLMDLLTEAFIDYPHIAQLTLQSAIAG